ncbi:MAG: leucine-rich repeat protein [Lachnospiraceae bacterium]|nr:leucine-rich repeat protein [Lachnospiraceae bacterium]
MKVKNIKKKLLGMLLAGAMALTAIPMTAAAESYEDVEGDPTLRNYAEASVSFFNYGMGADNFSDSNTESFWNAHDDKSLTDNTYSQWMMYDLSTYGEAEITGSTIIFYDDGSGVMTPTDITIEYATEDDTWAEVTPTGTWTYTGNTAVTYEHEPVTTSKVRVTMEHAVSGTTRVAVAVKDWMLLGDVPETFPKPEAVEPEAPSADLTLPDVAVYATPSAHYTSPWENLNGINNAEFEPTGSDIGTNLGWGNWQQATGAKAWVQYDWDEAITTKTFQVYWYGTEAGMKVPKDVGFQYKDENGTWQNAVLVSNPKNFSKFNRYNQITIEEITTKSIRMNMTVAGDSCGIYRWKVYSDVSDEFVVSAAGKSIEIPEVFDGVISSKIYKKLTLPSKALNNTVSVTWKSDNTEIISDTGEITVPKEDTYVTLTATCKAGDAEKSHAYKVFVLAEDSTEFALNVDINNEGVDISQELFGVFYEDINSSADGGLSTEMVKNNSFENYQNLDTPENPIECGDQTSWKLHWNSSNAANFTVKTEGGLNENNTNYAAITGNQTLKNHGFVRKASLDSPAMAVKEGLAYDFSVYMKADASYAGSLKVKVVNAAGTAITDEVTVDVKKDGTWQKVTADLKGKATELGTIVLTFEGASDTDVMNIDMVSLIPTDGYGYGNKNYSYGAGLRKDLVQKLQDLNPSFIRFPGGCIIEGSYGTDSYYNWEDTVGPLEERKSNASYWGTEGHPVQYTPNYGYMMSYQLGYHEILTLCEDLDAQAFPILSAGIYCQFRNTANAASGDELEPFAKHATNLIDYCWGSVDSENASEAYWAAKRVQNGHAEPFELNYVGIGNENWNDVGKGISYKDNFLWIKKYIDKYVEENYPGRKITIISSTGPYYQGGQNTEAWNWISSEVPGETLVDEHYYINYTSEAGNTLLSDDYVYDSYKRLDEGGSNVFVGEYAGHNNNTTENILETAISEAAYMTGLERNGDIVRHASYAPLMEKEGNRDWDYNLIKFDEYSSYGTPSYYVQCMYANNYGTKIVNTTLEKLNADTGLYEERKGHQKDVYYVSSKDDAYVYLKLVNHDEFEKDITLNYPGIKNGTKAELITLSGEAFDQNSIKKPTNVAPKTTETAIVNEKMLYTMPAMSFTVIKVQYAAIADDGGNDGKDDAGKDDGRDDGGKDVITNPSGTTGDQSGQTGDIPAGDIPTADEALKNGDTLTNGGIFYRVTNAKKKEAEAYKPTKKTAKTLKIANTVKIKNVTCKVVAISAGAFSNMKKLTKVTIPKNVTKVGAKAFYKDAKLKKVIFKSTKPKSIGKNAFKGIAKKATIDVPNKQKNKYKKLLKSAKTPSSVKVK